MDFILLFCDKLTDPELSSKVEVYSPSQKLIRFGGLRVGKKVKHVVPIVNRSSRSISMNLSINPLNSHLQEQGVLKILPYGTIELAGKGGKRDVEVHFHPQKRTETFTEEVTNQLNTMIAI